jgi:hypothetical protein
MQSGIRGFPGLAVGGAGDPNPPRESDILKSPADVTATPRPAGVRAAALAQCRLATVIGSRPPRGTVGSWCAVFCVSYRHLLDTEHLSVKTRFPSKDLWALLLLFKDSP